MRVRRKGVRVDEDKEALLMLRVGGELVLPASWSWD